MIDFYLFVLFPYVAVIIAVGGSIWRYVSNRFSFSSISSQFLENRQLFWGSVPWHYGIITILIGHLIGIIFPSGVTAFNGVPVRLYILEGTALALGLLTLVGLIVLVIRRGANARLRMVTSPMDVTLLVVLTVQVVSGVGTAIFHRWGSAWFAETASPYIRSLFTLTPRTELIAALPLLTRVHAISAFALVAIFPFTRLVHMVSIPVAYIWRRNQITIWNRRPELAKGEVPRVPANTGPGTGNPPAG